MSGTWDCLGSRAQDLAGWVGVGGQTFSVTLTTHTLSPHAARGCNWVGTAPVKVHETIYNTVMRPDKLEFQVRDPAAGGWACMRGVGRGLRRWVGGCRVVERGTLQQACVHGGEGGLWGDNWREGGRGGARGLVGGLAKAREGVCVGGGLAKAQRECMHECGEA